MGYVNGFFYEVGFKSHYHIPYKLVELNLSTILAPASLTISTYLFMVLIIVVPPVLIFLLILLIKSRVRKKRIEKAATISNKRSDAVWNLIVMILIVIAVAVFSRGMGRSIAEGSKDFLTFSEFNKKYIVIDIYQDQFIVSEICQGNTLSSIEFREIKSSKMKLFKEHFEAPFIVK